jgi:phosphodiesterase/alkaline phosphatase D-like protein
MSNTVVEDILLNRRNFLKTGAAAFGAAAAFSFPALGQTDWDQGNLAHLLPLADHQRFLIKTSFTDPVGGTPALRVGGKTVPGERTDTAGRFWQFYAQGLEPSQEYDLQLVDGAGQPLCDPWPLKTFPAPDAPANRVRLMVYTCAGGNDISISSGTPWFVPRAIRQRLFARALSFEPDAAVGIGDQVYWDQQTAMLKLLNSPNAMIRQFAEKNLEPFGRFDRALPVFGTDNEDVIKRVVDPQLAALYGVMFRSVPTILTQDDHDYFEDDRADDNLVSFPPDPFMMRLARATQRMYFPEFLPDPTRPAGIGGGAADRAPGLGECYGTLRYGNLLEVLLYDCRRYMTLKGASGGFITSEAEDWITARMASGDTRHVINMPSAPIGWSASKWAEWYPDSLNEAGELTAAEPKPFWQAGWFNQHQRLIEAASQTLKLPLFVSGDLHCSGFGAITKSGSLDLSENPVTSLLSGTISTSAPGWPSKARGVGASVPTALQVDEKLAPLEKNGFTILDVEPGKIRARLFVWRLGELVDNIDTLEPILDVELTPRA